MTRHLTRHERPHATKNMVVYSKATGVRRRVIDADHDDEYQFHIDRLHPGEGHFFLSHADYDSHTCPHALNHTVARMAGFDAAPHPHADRHAIVHTESGEIRGYAHLDLTCGDTAPEDHHFVHTP